MPKQVKKRHWAFVLYPESMPEDAFDRIQLRGLPTAVSPLHDKDLDPTGEPKKPHYHVIICYDGPTTFNNVKALTDELNAPIPIPLDSVRGMYRYLTHEDNPDKYQYDSKDIKCINGFCITDFVELTKAEVDELINEMHRIIRDNEITELADLADLLLDNDMKTHLNVLHSHTMFIQFYITSLRNRYKPK